MWPHEERLWRAIPFADENVQHFGVWRQSRAQIGMTQTKRQAPQPGPDLIVHPQ